MPESLEVNENCPPQIREALTECSNGIRISESKADIYLRLSQGEADDAVFEACRSMHQFYSSMREFFHEEYRALTNLLKTHEQPSSHSDFTLAGS